MYEPRRVSAEPVELLETEASDSPFVVGPRRAMPTRTSLLRTRLVPAATSVALLAGASVFALNLKASEVSTAVPAPLRSDSVSRDTERIPTSEITGSQAPSATPEASETTPAEADAEATTFAVGNWGDAFGASAGTRYAQTGLTVRSQASKESKKLGSLARSDKVTILDKKANGYRQIEFDGKIGYALDSELGKEKPAPVSSSTYTGSTTYTGKTVLGLKPKAMVVYNAVTAKWSFSSIGGYRPSSRSNHQFGGAIDFMLTPGKDSAKGWAVAQYLAANASTFDIDHIIFEQKIWTPYNPTWRPMEDRGSTTANHYDHVHVSVKL
ncbi:MAG: SH3 domain-containing protein [Propioniciclava sp.]